MVWPGRATISNNKCMLGPEDMEDNTKLVTMALTMEVILNSSNKEPTTWQLTSNNNSNLVTINNNNNNMEDILNSNSSGILEVRDRDMIRATGLSNNNNNTWDGHRECTSGTMDSSNQTTGAATCLPELRQQHQTCTTTPSNL